MNRRPWKVALPITLAALYVPTLVPFVSGPLTGCEHCVRTYLGLLPLVPGFFAGNAFVPDHTLVGAGAVTLLLFAGLLFFARRLSRNDLLAACCIAAPLVGVQSHLLGILLRA